MVIASCVVPFSKRGICCPLKWHFLWTTSDRKEFLWYSPRKFFLFTSRNVCHVLSRIPLRDPSEKKAPKETSSEILPGFLPKILPSWTFLEDATVMCWMGVMDSNLSQQVQIFGIPTKVPPGFLREFLLGFVQETFPRFIQEFFHRLFPQFLQGFLQNRTLEEYLFRSLE